MYFRSLKKVSAMVEKAGFEIVDRRPLTFSIIKAIDWPTEASHRRWEAFWGRVAPLINTRPALMGRLLYTLDSLVLPFLKDGPSVEIMICRKVKTVPAWKD
jgi:hypothetical protein